MPTLTVETTICTPGLRKRFSQAITRHLQKEHILANHVITRYYEIAPSHVYSGMVSFDRFPSLAGKAADFAFVTCSMANERDEAFQKRLGRVILDALQPDIPADFIFITFHLVDPRQTFVGLSGLQEREEQDDTHNVSDPQRTGAAYPRYIS